MFCQLADHALERITPRSGALSKSKFGGSYFEASPASSGGPIFRKDVSETFLEGY
jgi:hypothetical protein